MKGPVKVIIELKQGADIMGHLDFLEHCDDSSLEWHRNSMCRPVVTPDPDINPKQAKERYCLACWIDDDESLAIKIGDDVW